MQIQSNVILAPYTSWQIGGPAEFFALPSTPDEVKFSLAEAQKNNWRVTVLGGGTNVLVSDQGVRGLVLCLKNLVGIEHVIKDQDLYITALAGTSKSELLRIFLKHKLPAALFMAGLPGDIGGGVVMNAGVAESFSPREFGELVEWVEVMRPGTGKVERIAHQQIRWTYRHTEGWQPGVVVRVGFKIALKPEADILEKVKNANRIRLSKQPLDKPSCGSVFVNPQGHKAAQLIESCGLKGLQVGDAQVSLKHANFIVNLGRATASDVQSLIQKIQEKVLQEKGVSLKTEVVFLTGDT